MARSIAQLIARLNPDPQRAKIAFSPDIEAAHRLLFAHGKSDEELAAVIAKWLQRSQPCLFGRIAAGPANLLSFCVLTDEDLSQSDREIKNKIQRFRLLWRREAFFGLRSGFVISVISERISNALPDENLKALAIRLCSLYLLEEVVIDKIHHDRITLEIPEDDQPAAWYEWLVGANFFASAGDKRWWHDHRIPGGIAFSMNSVGHMARSGALQNMRRELDGLGGRGSPIANKLGISSLESALKFAILTINGAQETVSGKATCLKPLSDENYARLSPKCPIHKLPPDLARVDYTSYQGWYHTDHTIPADYFQDDIVRPARIGLKELDFRYLFDDDFENQDFERMGTGVRNR